MEAAAARSAMNSNLAGKAPRYSTLNQFLSNLSRQVNELMAIEKYTDVLALKNLNKLRAHQISFSASVSTSDYFQNLSNKQRYCQIKVGLTGKYSTSSKVEKTQYLLGHLRALVKIKKTPSQQSAIKMIYFELVTEAHMPLATEKKQVHFCKDIEFREFNIDGSVLSPPVKDLLAIDAVTYSSQALTYEKEVEKAFDSEFNPDQYDDQKSKFLIAEAFAEIAVDFPLATEVRILLGRLELRSADRAVQDEGVKTLKAASKTAERYTALKTDYSEEKVSRVHAEMKAQEAYARVLICILKAHTDWRSYRATDARNNLSAQLENWIVRLSVINGVLSGLEKPGLPEKIAKIYLELFKEVSGAFESQDYKAVISASKNFRVLTEKAFDSAPKFSYKFFVLFNRLLSCVS